MAATMMECTLVGAINHASLGPLLERIRWICGHKEIPFQEWECVFKGKSVIVSQDALITGARPDIIEFRTVCKFDNPIVTLETTPSSSRDQQHSNINANTNIDDNNHPRKQRWYLKYLGTKHLKNRSTFVRSVTIAETSDNINDFLQDKLGLEATFDYEFLRKGYVFYSKVFHIKIAVFSLYKFVEPHKVESCVPVDEDTIVVEISALVTSDKVPDVEDEMQSLAAAMSHLVEMTKGPLGAAPAAAVVGPPGMMAGPAAAMRRGAIGGGGSGGGGGPLSPPNNIGGLPPGAAGVGVGMMPGRASPVPPAPPGGGGGLPAANRR